MPSLLLPFVCASFTVFHETSVSPFFHDLFALVPLYFRPLLSKMLALENSLLFSFSARHSIFSSSSL